MSSVFSDYVRSLASERPPDPAAYDELLRTLRGALVHELKKRSLWNAPPSYLGIYGGVCWTQGDVLEDLLLDCYLFIFVRRLAGLRKQLLVRDNVDGLIFLNIRNFLHDAQKRHDPLGFRVFEVLHAAVSRLVDAGVLHHLAGDARIRNDTVLGFASCCDVRTAGDVDLGPLVEDWSQRLLPDLVTAWSTEDVRLRLEGVIAALPAQGVEVFLFRDLVESMKNDVRARWSALHLDTDETVLQRTGDDELASIVRWVRPDLGFEERQAFQKLLECVAEGLEKLRARRKTRDYLGRLWFFLRSWAAEPGGENENRAPESSFGEHLPPATRLSELLGIPRERIPDLKAILGNVVGDCRGEVYGGAATSPPAERAYNGSVAWPQPSYAGAGGHAVMDLKKRREQLRLLTGEVAARIAAEHPSADRGRRPPQLGETWVFRETRAWPVEWLVVRADSAGRVLVAPVDDNPLVGSRDVALPAAEVGSAVLRVRCGCGTWIDTAAFERGVRSGVVGPEASGTGVVERLGRRWSEISGGRGKVSATAREVDADPEYTGWIAALGEARRALPGDPQPAEAVREAERSKVVPFRRGRWLPRLGYGLAATFAAASVGLSVWVGQLRNELSSPLILPTFTPEEIVVQDPGRPVGDLVLKATDTHVLVHLLFSDVEKPPAFRLVLTREGGSVVWRSPMTSTETDDQFLLAIPRRRVGAGRYRLEVLVPDEEKGGERLVDGRDVSIELP